MLFHVLGGEAEIKRRMRILSKFDLSGSNSTLSKYKSDRGGASHPAI